MQSITNAIFQKTAASSVADLQKRLGLALLGSAGLGFSALLSTKGKTQCSSDGLESPHYHWPHSGVFSSFDAASIRRGYQVYRQVCATCHSMKLIAFRNLVGVSHTTEQAKAIAAATEIKDGPNDEGEYFERPGKLSDRFPSPYPNEQAGRYVNGGAYPPDLSLMAKARHGGENYIFALLTGYRDPPAGVTLRDGLHYNIYFPGGAISMAKALNDGAVDYEDGTPATTSQMAKDVSTFLAWTAEPEHDDRKRAGIKFIVGLTIAAAAAGYWKRFSFAIFKAQKIRYQ